MRTSLATGRKRAALAAGAAFAALLVLSQPARTAEIPLAPQTKLRVTVVQWMPIKGAYEQWAALGGEFSVSDTGTVVLPVIGSIPVGTLDGAALAQEISNRLQTQTGLVDKPNTTVEIVEYPPVYVVGDVTTPGAYSYRAGMTVLQALALGGGQYREGRDSSRDAIRLAGDLRGFDNEILRSKTRIARLSAEMADAKEIAFPPAPSDVAGKALADEVSVQEKTIFLARANELERQTKSLTELRELLGAEIGVLEQKITAADEGIKSVEKELAGVTVLVERGIAIASRRSDLERLLNSHRSDRLDQVTAIMRARQGIAEATRSLDGLLDSRRTQVASELQTEQSGLEQTLLKREVSQKLLIEMLSAAPSGLDEQADSFTVIRRDGEKTVESEALQSTVLRPGDVIKVTSNNRATREPSSERPDEQASSEGATQ